MATEYIRIQKRIMLHTYVYKKGCLFVPFHRKKVQLAQKILAAQALLMVVLMLACKIIK